jgi:hypothetical protein
MRRILKLNSFGMPLDANGYVIVNHALTGGVTASIDSRGLPRDANGYLLVDCATGCTGGSGSSLLNSSGPQSAIVGTGAAANIYSFTVPANTMSATSCLRVTMGWQHSTGSASVTFAFSFGGSSQTIIAATSAGFGMSTWLVCNTSTSAQNAIVNAPGYLNGILIPANTTLAIDTTVNQTIAATFNVAATDQVTPKFWMVESVH